MGKHKCPEFENHERWLVSYADMVTLLFAVFVVLYALKEDGEKANDAAGSLEESFNKPLEDIPPSQRTGPSTGGFGVFENQVGNAQQFSNATMMHEKLPPISLIDDEMNQTKRLLEERLYGPNKFRKSQKPGNARIISVERTRSGFKVRLVARYFYQKGAVSVSKKSERELSQIVRVLKDLDREIRVEGHSDSLGVKSMNNWDLSALRASRVVKYMVEKHRFNPEFLSAAGYGSARPMASNSTEAGRSVNRRIEFQVKYDSDTSRGTP